MSSCISPTRRRWFLSFSGHLGLHLSVWYAWNNFYYNASCILPPGQFSIESVSLFSVQIITSTPHPLLYISHLTIIYSHLPLMCNTVWQHAVHLLLSQLILIFQSSPCLIVSHANYPIYLPLLSSCSCNAGGCNFAWSKLQLECKRRLL